MERRMVPCLSFIQEIVLPRFPHLCLTSVMETSLTDLVCIHTKFRFRPSSCFVRLFDLVRYIQRIAVVNFAILDLEQGEQFCFFCTGGVRAQETKPAGE